MKNMSDGLTRQRRNLFVVSILLWFLHYGGVEIGQLSVLGIEIKHFSNADAVYIALWLGWMYSLVRYYQYFAQEGFPKLCEALAETLDEICAPKIRRKILELHPNDFREDCGLHTLKKWEWTYHGQEKVGQNSAGQERIENYIMKFSPWWLWKEILRSFWSITINQSAITDYILPLILALYVVINGFSGWQGGIYEVFFS